MNVNYEFATKAKKKSRCPKAAAFVSKYELGIIRKD
jgi:hypothetical protein